MKKKFMAVAMATSMAATALVGCSSGGSNVQEKVTVANGGDETAQGDVVDGYSSYQKRKDLTETVELKVWESQNGPDEFIKQAAAKFTEIYPNITIVYENVESSDAKDKISNDGPAGIGPDLFAAANDCAGTMAAAGTIQPLDDIGATYVESVKQSVPQMCTDGVTVEDKVWGFPVARETYTLYYNKESLKDFVSSDADLDTWEKTVEVCKKWNAANSGKYCLMWQAGNTYHNIFWLTSDEVSLFGPNHNDYSQGTGVNNETSIAGATFYQSLRKDILDVAAQDLSEDATVAAFENENSAMIIDGSWKIGAYEDALGDKLAAKTLPSLPGQSTPAHNFAGVRTMYVSAYSNHPKEAAAFGEFLMCKEMQTLRMDICSTLPATEEVEISDPIMQAFVDQLQYAFAMPPIQQINMYWTCFDAVYKTIWDGEDPATQIGTADDLFKSFAGV